MIRLTRFTSFWQRQLRGESFQIHGVTVPSWLSIANILRLSYKSLLKLLIHIEYLIGQQSCGRVWQIKDVILQSQLMLPWFMDLCNERGKLEACKYLVDEVYPSLLYASTKDATSFITSVIQRQKKFGKFPSVILDHTNSFPNKRKSITAKSVTMVALILHDCSVDDNTLLHSRVDFRKSYEEATQMQTVLQGEGGGSEKETYAVENEAEEVLNDC
ncbi:hypothetical protein V6N13_089565 [Hibiscus sabdariffa]|uniref:Uncharacterized protein n=1 Tax=Hibiscus sabdariffa TaxID=183260 RepID=A0ABR2QJG7_9ROSI